MPRPLDRVDGGLQVAGPFGEKLWLGIKVDWFESGLFRFIQAAEDVVQYVARDEQDNFVNRYVLASARPQDTANSTYCLAPFNRSDAHTPDEIPDGCSWFWMQEPSLAGLRQVVLGALAGIASVIAWQFL